MMRALIVDDEAPARRELTRMLGDFADLTVVGEAADVAAAARVLEKTAPDVVFLDIRLGQESGFDLLPRIERDTAVVFVTAYSDHAVRAFESEAADYLLKPVAPERLAHTVERLRSRFAAPAPTPPAAARDWILCDDRDKPELIAIGRITHIVAEGSRSRIHTEDGRARSTGRSLADWERRLGEQPLVRVHRSTLVNLKQVERLEPWFHYGLRVYVRGTAEPIAVSRRRAAELRERLG